MTKTVLLNNVDHADLTVAWAHGPEFGNAVNQVLAFPTEFEALAREYPILFRKGADDAWQALVLLGLDKDENLFLSDGLWDADYVPAVQQRGPFSIRVQDGAEPMVLVDLDDPRVSAEGGQPLFLRHGGNSPLLDRVTGLLRAIHAGQQLLPPMFAAFEEFGLIEPVRLEITLADERRYVIPDRHTIAAERLAALTGSELERLHRGGFLACAFQVQSSLANLHRLVAKKNRRLSFG